MGRWLWVFVFIVGGGIMLASGQVGWAFVLFSVATVGVISNLLNS